MLITRAYWLLRRVAAVLWQGRRVPGCRLLFLFLSGMYRVFQAAGELPSRLGWRTPRSLPIPVISVGNLEMGGTGKTPMVRFLAEAFVSRGVRTAVLSRGYARRGRGQRVVSDGSTRLADYPESGDEPALFSRWLPGAPVLVGKNRFLSGTRALRDFGTQLALLDDGFSYRGLGKDMEIMMMSTRSDRSDLRLFPAGTLREPFSRIRWSDVVVWMGNGNNPEMVRKVSAVHPGGVMFRADYRLTGFRPLRSSSRTGSPAGSIRRMKAVGIAGIASPESFFHLLEKEGINLVGRIAYPDHYPYRECDVDAIESKARAGGGEVILTTEKDGVRLEGCGSGGGGGIPWYAVTTELTVDRADEFIRLLSSRITDRVPTIFLDRDGTVNEPRDYIVDPGQLGIAPGALEAIRRINASPYLAVLVSNQSAIGRGMASESRIRSVHLHLEELLASGGAWLDGAYYCPHRPEAGCGCRKPETGLIRKAAAELGIDLACSYLVGDKESDISLARRLGIRSVRITPAGNGNPEGSVRADFHARDLAEAVDWILGSHPERREDDNGNRSGASGNPGMSQVQG